MQENDEVTEDAQEVSQAGTEIKDPKAVLEALERAKTDAKTFRERLEEEGKNVKALQDKILALESDEGITGLKRKIIDLQVKAALAKEGIKDSDRVSKYLSLEGLDLDDDGNLLGFEENLKRVKEDLPELFDPKRRVGGAADLFEKEEAKHKKTGTQMQLDALYNRS